MISHRKNVLINNKPQNKNKSMKKIYYIFQSKNKKNKYCFKIILFLYLYMEQFSLFLYYYIQC